MRQFTKEQAKAWADMMIKGQYSKVGIFTDGVTLRLTTGSDGNVVASYPLPKGRQSTKSAVLKLNPKHFQNGKGRILKGELVEFLYKEVNSLIQSHQIELNRRLSKQMFGVYAENYKANV